MSISFNQVPTNNRVPFVFVEFDSSKSQQGPSIKSYKAMMFGQKTSSGSATANTPTSPITSEAQAISLFGRGSFLHAMCKQFLKNNKFTELTVMPLADNGAGVAATGTLTFSGTATAAGTLNVYIGGQLIQVAVASGDTAATVATNLAAALTTDLPVTGAAVGAVVTLTCLHKGLLGNSIDVRLNYQIGDATPAGITVVIAAMASGTTAPTLTTAISNMTERQFDVIVFPFTDATSMTAIEAELDDRWGPIRQNDGHVISCKDDTVANLGTFGLGRNSKHVTCFGIYKSPTPCYEIAAMAGGVAAYYLQQDPARPLQTLPLVGALAPADIDQFHMSERNILLHDGIATMNVSSDKVVHIERPITMYQLNSASAPDVAYLDITTLMTLSYIRYDFRNHLMINYPRHKLGDDGKLYGAGQAIMTPKLGRAIAIGKFRQWEELGLVEGADQFKRDLIVERNGGDVNRLDFLLAPNLMNQLTIMGVQIQFLL